MNKIISKLGISGLLILMMSGMAHAVEEPYWGIGHSVYILEADVPGGNNLEFDMDGLRFTLGSTLTNNFGIETRIIFKGHGDNDSGVSLDPELITNVMANFNFPLGPLTLFANAGYTASKFEINSLNDLTFDEEGISVGGGLNYTIRNNLSIYADATSYLITNDDFDLNSFSAGIRFLIR